MEEARNLVYRIRAVADTQQAQASIQHLISGLGHQNIHVNADTQQAQSNIQNLVSTLGSNGQHTINVNANTSGAQGGLHDLTNNLNEAGSQANSLASTFRRSFLEATDSGRSFAASLRSGVTGAARQVGVSAVSAFASASASYEQFSNRVSSGASRIGEAFRNPIQTIRTGFSSAITSVQGRFTSLIRGAEQASSATGNLGNAAGSASGHLSQLGAAAESAGSRFGGLSTVLTGVGATVAAAGVAVGGFVASSVSVGMDFDKAMSQVAATMGKSVSDLQNEVGSVDTTFGHFEGNLREYAQFMGSNTAFSATEAANALNYMALAGYDTEKSMSMLPTVLNLAAAGNMELAAASDMVTDAASALGLSTEQTTVMVDQMAMASSKSNTSVEQLGSAMLQVGGTAKVMAGGTKEIAEVLGVMADNGIKGAEGGTHLRNMLLKLSKPTKDGAAALEELGVKVFDAEGKMRAFPDIFSEMGNSLSQMTDEDRLQTITKIFDSYDVAAVNALLGTSKKRWDELDGSIEKAQGAAARMAATQLDNLEGDVTLFKSALEGVQIAVADRVMPGLRAMTQVGGAVLSGVTAVLKNEQDELFSQTNMNATELAKAMFQVGGAANDLAGRGTEASVALGILADNGLKGAEGGTKLRDVIQSIAQPTEEGAAALKNLGVDVRDAKGNMRSFTEIFPELNEAMAGLTDDERRNAISAIFNAEDIGAANALLGTTKDRWNELGQSAGGMSTNMSNAIATVTDLASQGMEFAKTLAQGFAEGLPEVAAQLPLVLAGVFDFLAENSPAMLEQGGQLLATLGMGIINAIPALLSNLPTLIESIVGYIRAEAPAFVQTGVELILHLAGGILNALPDVLSAIVSIGGALVDAAMNIPGLLIDVGVAIVKGLWTGISETGEWLIGMIPGFFGKIVDSVKSFLGIASPSKVFAEIGDNMALGIGEGFSNTIGGVIDFITGLLPTDFSLPDFGSLFDSLPSLDDVSSFFGNLADVGMELVQDLADGIMSGLPMLLEVLFPVPVMIYEFFAENGQGMLEQGIEFITNLGEGILSGLPELMGFIAPIPVMVYDFFTGEAPTFISVGLEAMVALAGGVSDGIAQVLDAVAQLASGIVSALASLPGEMVSIGTNIVQGVWQGISSAGGWLTSQVSGFFSNIVSNVKSSLGIASPSKVFAEIGDNMALGVGKGFGDTIGGVTKGIEASIPKELELPKVNAQEVNELGNLLSIDIPEYNRITGLEDLGIQADKIAAQKKQLDEMLSGDVSYQIQPVIGDIAPQRDELGNLLGIDIPEYNRITGDEDIGIQADKLKAQEKQLADLLSAGMTVDVSPLVEDVEMPEVPDIDFGVKPMLEDFMTTLPDLAVSVVPEIAELVMPKVDLPDETFGVNPVMGDVVMPEVPDIDFGVKPMLEGFKLPSFSGLLKNVKGLASNMVNSVMGDFAGPVLDSVPDAGTSETADAVVAAATQTTEDSKASSSSSPFAPVISITVNGNATEQTVEDMKISLYDTVKELFQEFREAEYERMALKNQYSFR